MTSIGNHPLLTGRRLVSWGHSRPAVRSFICRRKLSLRDRNNRADIATEWESVSVKLRVCTNAVNQPVRGVCRSLCSIHAMTLTTTVSVWKLHWESKLLRVLRNVTKTNNFKSEICWRRYIDCQIRARTAMTNKMSFVFCLFCFSDWQRQLKWVLEWGKLKC